MLGDCVEQRPIVMNRNIFPLLGLTKVPAVVEASAQVPSSQLPKNGRRADDGMLEIGTSFHSQPKAM